jgi:hypothetical protein
MVARAAMGQLEVVIWELVQCYYREFKKYLATVFYTMYE